MAIGVLVILIIRSAALNMQNMMGMVSAVGGILGSRGVRANVGLNHNINASISIPGIYECAEALQHFGDCNVEMSENFLQSAEVVGRSAESLGRSVERSTATLRDGAVNSSLQLRNGLVRSSTILARSSQYLAERVTTSVGRGAEQFCTELRAASSMMNNVSRNVSASHFHACNSLSVGMTNLATYLERSVDTFSDAMRESLHEFSLAFESTGRSIDSLGRNHVIASANFRRGFEELGTAMGHVSNSFVTGTASIHESATVLGPLSGAGRDFGFNAVVALGVVLGVLMILYSLLFTKEGPTFSSSLVVFVSFLLGGGCLVYFLMQQMQFQFDKKLNILSAKHAVQFAALEGRINDISLVAAAATAASHSVEEALSNHLASLNNGNASDSRGTTELQQKVADLVLSVEDIQRTLDTLQPTNQYSEPPVTRAVVQNIATSIVNAGIDNLRAEFNRVP